MNYFFENNKEKVHSFNYEVDSLSCLKKDIFKNLNNANPNHIQKILLRKKNEQVYLYQKINDEVIDLSIDFIGPSKYHAEVRNVGTEFLVSYIVSRSIGGHIFFPTQKGEVNAVEKSLNQIRSYRFQERFDYFLFELKMWYSNKNTVKASENVLEINREWLNQFKDFIGYIKYFQLYSFVNKNYDVYDLSSFDGKTYTQVINAQPLVRRVQNKADYPKALQEAYIPIDYKTYIRGCVFAICQRTETMTGKRYYIDIE